MVLAASACESARLLLNSRSSRFPQGLANASGVVGKYLTDTTGTDVAGFIPAMMDHVPHNEDGTGGNHSTCRGGSTTRPSTSPGATISRSGAGSPPSYGFMGGSRNIPSGGGYGKSLKDQYRKYYGSTIGFSGRGEMIPNENSYCEIDPKVVDRWGIPVLRFHWKWTDYEYKQVKHMQETFRALIAEMGGKVFEAMPGAEDGYGIANGGSIIHELGVVRMGNDPKTSALNKYCQSHEVKNLFVADGGPFVSQADKNPTWTILALSMRTSEYIIQQRKAGAI